MPNVGTQEPQKDFKGQWQPCRPETVAEFSAVGYFFGRRLHQTLDVPVGLINDAWGGSACEAWIRRDLLAADCKVRPAARALGADSRRTTRGPRPSTSRSAPSGGLQPTRPRPRASNRPARRQNPDDQMRGNARPGNIYNGVLKPTIGYGIRGVIWYQGESNAGRAYQYRDLFPLMIKSWRDEWGQGDFPFYWVQLADFLPRHPSRKRAPGPSSARRRP